MAQLILASGSPRRKDYMHGLGVDFEVDKPAIDETPLKGETPRVYVERIAREKGSEVAKRQKGKIILAADTTVAIGRKIYGKPEDKNDAERMLKEMSGKRQKVLSSVAVIDANGKVKTKTTSTIVKFKVLRQKDIDRHLADENNWADACGGWKILHPSSASFVMSMNGSITGVVGLPLVETVNILRSSGLDI